MKKFTLLFLPVICLAGEPKFHYMDCVKVTNGFYRGCKGRVQRLEEVSNYEVYISDCRENSTIVTFEEKDLELSNGCKK